MMNVGWLSLCLRVNDLEVSKKFYSGLGMQLVSEVEGKTAILSYGTFRIALMTFLEENLLNFRGGDVFETFSKLKSEFPELEGEAERYDGEKYDSQSDGACWSTRDPDGNEVFFDTNEAEIGADYIRDRTVDILRGAAAELRMVGGDLDLIEMLESKATQTQ